VNWRATVQTVIIFGVLFAGLGWLMSLQFG